MTIASGAAFLRNPTTPAQLRALIASLREDSDTQNAAIDVIEGDIADIEGDIADLEGQSAPITTTFDVAASKGAPVRVLATGNVVVAQADSVTNARVAGLAFEDVAMGASGMFVPIGGRVSSDDWTDVTGSTALTPGATYFLSATAGELVTTPPSSPGQVVAKVGRALTATVLVVELGPNILL